MFYLEIDEEVTLKLLVLTDAERLFHLIDTSRHELREWLAWVDFTKIADDSKTFIDHSLQQYRENKGLSAAIMYQNQLVGVVSFNDLDWDNRIGSIGYWLGSAYQGKGIMTRSVRAMVDYGFNKLALNRIEIRCIYENTKSRSIPEQLGFTEEGLLRQVDQLHDHYVDHVVYGMVLGDRFLVPDSNDANH